MQQTLPYYVSRERMEDKLVFPREQESRTYLSDLISGVPFHSKEDLGKNLWHVEAVLSETVKTQSVLGFVQPAKIPHDGVKESHLCLHTKSFSCSVISDSGSLVHT